MSPEKLNSKYGEYLRDLMHKKLDNPEFDVGTLKLQAWKKANWRTKFRASRRKESIYIPAHVKANVDWTQYMLRSPNQFTWSEYSDFIKAVDALENQKDNENEL